ncbi:MAG: type II toxin-antitoxin system CcdA family antitoxin [Thermoproteota archaeon]|jgi:post-segregation antitoxin (ccd killing protein)|nr:type II toxin-antitoxin system CcdA family antitoxin [Thermoproteota archaeon]
MGSWVTVSTKVRKELLEKARKYGINVSKTLRNALEEEVKRKEIEETKRLFEEASKELSKISSDEIVSEIRKMRETR